MVRCKLTHDAAWSEDVVLTDDGPVGFSIGYKDGKYRIGNNIVQALGLTVLLAKENADLSFAKAFSVKIGNDVVDLNRFWGKYEEFMLLRKSQQISDGN